MNQKKFNQILLKYEANRCSEEERARVEAWYKNLQSSKDIANPTKAMSRIFENIETGLEKKAKIRWRRLAVGIAALLVAAVGISFYFLTISGNSLDRFKSVVAKEETTPILNKSSLPQSVTLSDGTKIILAPESKLSVISFTEAVRQVRLQGKAFFEVAHDEQRPFYVYTENLVTQALGTSFTIDTHSDNETVEVRTGRVAVFPKTKNNEKGSDDYVTITPNLRVEYSKSRKKLTSTVVKHPRLVAPVLSAGRAIAPTSGEISAQVMKYQEAPVSEILQSLEKAYGVKIIFNQNKLSSCLLTVNLKDEDLFTRLKAICQAIGGSYQVVGAKIVVSSKGCY